MGRDWLGMMKRGMKKPPRYIVQRTIQEVRGQVEKYIIPRRVRQFSATTLAKRAGYSSVVQWWDALTARPYVSQTSITPADLERDCPGELFRIQTAAQDAIAHRVDLLGSGAIELGDEIDWHCDYKTGHRWSPAYCRDIEYNNPDCPSDVKFPWELSRMQWMIPLGQAYILTGEERYATVAKDLLDHWIKANPYAGSVNWACTMEVALRILSWTWFFHAFKHCTAWADDGFRERFLQSLYLHGDFAVRNLEKSDINGNHFTADAAGLVFAGLFFGKGDTPQQWQKLGWDILCEELPRQVFPDGVDFEASVAYHRLVQELFLLPALYRRRQGLDVPDYYRDRLITMARFTAAYSRPDGSVPLWGDADDARALPQGGQSINDHRYLMGLVGTEFDVDDLRDDFSGSRSEVFWIMGATVAGMLPNRDALNQEQHAVAFPDGGFYILRSRIDHVFVDCGPLGLGGRGGHGHNDMLSFEAVLDGVHLVSDCGAYLYTANYHERNRFRSTGYHNTPQVDGEEINRFIRWDYLWNFHCDARPELIAWQPGNDLDVLVASHTGYLRLADPVMPVRTILLDTALHALTIVDCLHAQKDHTITIPLHLSPGVLVQEIKPAVLALECSGKLFCCTWMSHGGWELSVEPARVSPSYGRAESAVRLLWKWRGLGLSELRVSLFPRKVSLHDVNARADYVLRGKGL